jgi:hypothetical protein
MIHPAQIVLGLLATAFSVGALLLLGGCASIGSPQLCLKTDYGNFCYQLPELPKPTSSK